MKKIGDLMMEMGFNKEAPESLKEAFIRHLVKQAEGVDLQGKSKQVSQQTRVEVKKKNSKELIGQPEQLEFDFYKKTSS